MKQLKIILFFLTILSFDGLSQKDSIQFKEKFILYKGNIYNKKDKDGKLTGKGLIILSDTTSNKETTYIVKNGTTQTTKDTSWYSSKYTVVGIGKYKKGKKQGAWYYSSENDIEKTDAKFIYSNDSIINGYCYENYEKKNIFIKLKRIDSTLHLYWLDPTTGKFIEKNNNLNLIKEMYHI